jgi:pimeloyl-ACP methyl ester carboxylesterase
MESTGVLIAQRDRVRIAYEAFGPPKGEPLLLIMGLGMQMIAWHDGFLRALVEQGFQVARFDNRDVGLSTHFAETGKPSVFGMIFRPLATASYGLDAMANDALVVLDALGWDSAHVVGGSLGGMIGQVLAVRHAPRVRTLTSMMATPCPRVGRSTIRFAMKIASLQQRPVRDREEAAQRNLDLFRLIGSPGYSLDEPWLREVGRLSYDRCYDPAGRLRQQAALLASGDRRKELSGVNVPTLVLHGEEDKVWRPSGGRATAEAIPGARLVTYSGMGHGALPREL